MSESGAAVERDGGMVDAILPLKGGYVVTLRIPRVLPEKSWEHMMQYLSVMKSGYVRKDDPMLAIDLRRGDDGSGIA